MNPPGAARIGRRQVLATGGAAALAGLAASTPAAADPAGTHPHGHPHDTFPLGPFTKYSGNPILTPDPGHDWESAWLFNPCAIVVDGHVALLYRAQNAAKTSSIGLATSTDGFHFERRPEPVLAPTEPYETPGGCEDPRVVRIDGTYYLTYTGYDGRHALLCLATSTDLVHWTKHGPLFPNLPDPGHTGRNPWNKSGAILTTPIGGYHWMYFGESNVFWARSKDLLHWETPGNDDPVATPAFAWERGLMEPGPPPVVTADGKILLVYNGRANGSGGWTNGQYSTGQLLIDPADPTKAIARLERPCLVPTADDEQNGQVNHVVFSEGLVRFHGRRFLYFGMADSVLGVATAP
ncbi:glycosylase [Actinocatenispora thailandica]|uniref:Glycosylase n=1 Tax=Actinocatenispora thailandica TaxID=227318 RepID=A0A7R7DTT5_9ACTN|nr:glycoside hydrolase family 130 protein [Actinocatenispora thailandica]BCJ37621.1 glycosylase [Actinocatenispora thailandica]